MRLVLPSASAEPFASDIAFIEAEGAFVLARSARLEAERSLKDELSDRLGRGNTIGSKPSTAAKELERKALNLREAEDKLRQNISRRVEASIATDFVAGLDALCGEFNLNQVERTTLLLATLAATDERYEDAIRSIATGCGGQTTPELVSAYLELGFAERIAARAAFQPSSPLLRNGLISLTVGRSSMPYDLRSAFANVTQRAFDVILGLPSDAGNHDGAEL